MALVEIDGMEGDKVWVSRWDAQPGSYGCCVSNSCQYPSMRETGKDPSLVEKARQKKVKGHESSMHHILLLEEHVSHQEEEAGTKRKRKPPNRQIIQNGGSLW